MPPKKAKMSKKAAQKASEKLIEDRTFGLKNKKKSKVRCLAGFRTRAPTIGIKVFTRFVEHGYRTSRVCGDAPGCRRVSC